MKKFIFSIVSLFVLVAFSACGKASVKEAGVEAALSKDSSVVFMFDYSDSAQVDDLKALFEQLPETGLGEAFIDGYNGEMDSEEMNFENTLGAVLKMPWTLAASVTLPKDIDSAEKLENLDPEDLEVVVAFKVEDPEAVENVIEILAEEALTGEERDGVMYYDSEENEEVRVARYGDMFIGANNEKVLKEAIDRINEGQGLDQEAEFQSKLSALREDYFSYFYVNGSLFGGVLADVYKQMGMGSAFADSFSLMGDSYVAFYADKGGIGASSNVKILGDKRDLAGVMPGIDHELSLVNKVNGNGVIMYVEQAGLGKSLGALLDYYANLFGYGYYAGEGSVDTYDPYGLPLIDEDVEASLDGATVQPTSSDSSFDLFDNSVLQTNVLGDELIKSNNFIRPMPTASLYEDVIEAISELSGVEVEDIKSIFDSPFALSFADNGGLIPTFTIYLEVDESLTEQAKKLAGAFDIWISQFIDLFDESIAGLGVPVQGALKKDVVLVNGGGLHRVYLDWSVLPEEAMSQIELPGLKLEDLSVELYYGLTGDNVFVLGFEPDFAENFGKNVLSSSDNYKEAVAKVEGSYGYMVSYFDLRPLVGLLDRYVELARVAKAIGASEIAEYDKAMAFVKMFKYMISTGKVDGDMATSEAYMAIGE